MPAPMLPATVKPMRGRSDVWVAKAGDIGDAWAGTSAPPQPRLGLGLGAARALLSRAEAAALGTREWPPGQRVAARAIIIMKTESHGTSTMRRSRGVGDPPRLPRAVHEGFEAGVAPRREAAGRDGLLGAGTRHSREVACMRSTARTHVSVWRRGGMRRTRGRRIRPPGAHPKCRSVRSLPPVQISNDATSNAGCSVPRSAPRAPAGSSRAALPSAMAARPCVTNEASAMCVVGPGCIQQGLSIPPGASRAWVSRRTGEMSALSGFETS